MPVWIQKFGKTSAPRNAHATTFARKEAWMLGLVSVMNMCYYWGLYSCNLRNCRYCWILLRFCCDFVVILTMKETKRVNTTQDVNNNEPAPTSTTIDKMDIDTTPKPTSPSKSPARSIPANMKECYVSIPPCPVFPTEPLVAPPTTIIPQPADHVTTPQPAATTTPQPATTSNSQDNQPIDTLAPNPTLSALSNEQPAKSSPKKRKLSPEEKQYVYIYLSLFVFFVSSP